MSIVSNIFKRLNVFRRSAEPQDIVIRDEHNVFGGGEGVRPASIATVMSCINVKANALASMGMQLLRKQSTVTGGERREVFVPDESSPLSYLIGVRPNARQTAYEFLWNLSAQLDLQGNAYVLPIWNGGDISELILLANNSVSYDKTSDMYRVNDCVNGITGTYHSADIIHVRNFCEDGGYEGVSTITFAARTLGLSYEVEQQQQDTFQPGNTMRGFISGDQSMIKGLGEISKERLNDASDTVRAQLRNGNHIFSLPGMLKFNQLSMNPADMQILETKKLLNIDICNFFRVPPEKIFQSGGANYKASENSQTIFMTDCLQPLMRKILSEFNCKLFSQRVLRRYKIGFNISHYYESDLETKADYYMKMMQTGALTPNEIRAREGLAPIEGGDKLFISCNVAPVEAVAQNNNNNNQNE